MYPISNCSESDQNKPIKPDYLSELIYEILKSQLMIQLAQVAVISAKNHKRQRRKRQSVTAKQEKSQTPKVLTAILTLPNLA